MYQTHWQYNTYNLLTINVDATHTINMNKKLVIPDER